MYVVVLSWFSVACEFGFAASSDVPLPAMLSNAPREIISTIQALLPAPPGFGEPTGARRGEDSLPESLQDHRHRRQPFPSRRHSPQHFLDLRHDPLLLDQRGRVNADFDGRSNGHWGSKQRKSLRLWTLQQGLAVFIIYSHPKSSQA
ncbi:MAG TPA: hypothetical protein VKA46_01705, partial [Gemmataceae bacterium]|nr:hypothetical protein [Gemmataceae bacterium]